MKQQKYCTSVDEEAAPGGIVLQFPTRRAPASTSLPADGADGRALRLAKLREQLDRINKMMEMLNG